MSRLNSQERRLLLTIARRAVHTRLSGTTETDLSIPEGPLQVPSGVFVSIHLRSRLRGCIGRIEPVATLSRTTAQCAVAAATADLRFAPLSLPELSQVRFEISVLSKPQRVAGADQVEIGRHGLLVEMGEQRGLLLPQVAAEYDWSGEEFLRQTCLKAGLPDGMKSSGLAVSIFEAQVFSEGGRG